MSQIISELAKKSNTDSGPELLFGKNDKKIVLIVAVSADRGVCGVFNNNISKEVRKRVAELENNNQSVRLIIVGRKAYTEGLNLSKIGIMKDNVSINALNIFILIIFSINIDISNTCWQMTWFFIFSY